MNHHTHRTDNSMNWMTGPLNSVRQRMAKALVGQAVSLVVTPQKITHGIVTDVLAETGIPLVVVDGATYNLNQVLTQVPAALGQ